MTGADSEHTSLMLENQPCTRWRQLWRPGIKLRRSQPLTICQCTVSKCIQHTNQVRGPNHCSPRHPPVKEMKAGKTGSCPYASWMQGIWFWKPAPEAGLDYSTEVFINWGSRGVCVCLCVLAQSLREKYRRAAQGRASRLET